MMFDNTLGLTIDDALIEKYFGALVNKVFKILPIAENQEESIAVYMESLSCELQGFQSLLPAVGEDPSFLSFVSILKWLSDTVIEDDVPHSAIRREVFHAISLCKKMQENYSGRVEGEVV